MLWAWNAIEFRCSVCLMRQSGVEMYGRLSCLDDSQPFLSEVSVQLLHD